MNEYDSNRILNLTKKIKYEPTKNLDEANCYILNTCHIREKQLKKSIMILVDLKNLEIKRNPLY